MSDLAFPQLDALIARFEGYNITGSPAQRNNNPGNIIAGPFANAQGASGSSGGFATFDTPESGFAAMDALIARYSKKGYTIADLMNKWAPGDAPGNTQNATDNYVNFVAKGLAKSPDTALSDLTKGIDGTGAIDKLKGILGRGGPLDMVSDVDAAIGTGKQVVSAAEFFTNPARIGLFLLGLLCIYGAFLVYSSPSVSSAAGTALRHAGTAVAII